MSSYFIFIMGDVFCFGNMDFVLTRWKLLFFQEKIVERLTSFFLMSLQIFLFVKMIFVLLK